MSRHAIAALCLSLVVVAAQDEPVGQRPYEMDWAGRTQNPTPALVDFERLDGWTAQTSNAVASVARTRDQQLWGRYVARLTYRADGPSPTIRLTPPQPIAIEHPFDHVSLWGYGNNWGFARDPGTPPVELLVVFAGAQGEVKVSLGRVNWKEWHLLYRALTPEQQQALAAERRFVGLEVLYGSNKEDRVLYFDDLAVFTEQLAPLSFAPRRQRNIALLPGADPGLNTGQGTLPFPTRPETILPTNLQAGSTSRVVRDGDSFRFEYRGDDGQLTYTLTPKTGSPSDVTAEWTGRGAAFQPMAGGGIKPEAAGDLQQQLVDASLAGDTVTCRSRWSVGGANGEATYTYRLWGKTLVIDVLAPGGGVGEVRFGEAAGLTEPRLVPLPYLSYRSAQRPCVVVAGPADAPLFLMGNADWYLSNGSELFAENRIADGKAFYNGGSRYNPKTDGQRNDVAERLFLTVSPRFEEVLPNVPNPVSPWKQITGTKLWRAHGASNRDNDRQYWRSVWRKGMREIVVTDHETGWRDGGESFTFRTRPAPGKGGDEGQYNYARFMQDTLGFTYGPYNNFTDFSPVNEFWSPDRVSRNPDGQLRSAWMRCYNPKPAVAVEFAEKLPPLIESKFDFSTAYCDVHTVAPPWTWVDYDARVPGAGTFSQTFYAYGEIMLMQKAAWDGPVYSEGGGHVYYTGLADGNYGQDQAYKFLERPWLVDFDLRKIHDLGCNFGMGNLGMFYGRDHDLGATVEERDRTIDRFLAATVAFGHPGFLVMEGGGDKAPRSYYLLQQLASRYTQVAADRVQYADAAGDLIDTSAAVANNVIERNQIVTRYTDGTTTWVNGNEREPMTIDLAGETVTLPPLGFAGRSGDGAVKVISGNADGRRIDYCESPAYIYLDGRGSFTRYGKAAGVGPCVARLDAPGTYEVIPLGGGECGFDLGWPGATAVALAEDGSELGPAEVRTSRGLLWVQPVDKAYSYRLKQAEATGPALTSARLRVVPGEQVQVVGRQPHTLAVPADAVIGSRLWQSFEGSWIDFQVVALADTALKVVGDTVVATLVSNLQAAAQAKVELAGQTRTVSLPPGEAVEVTAPVGPATGESLRPVSFKLAVGGGQQSSEWTLRTVAEITELVKVPTEFELRMALRGQAETADQTALAAARAAGHTAGEAISGGVQRQATNDRPVYRLHPPYLGGVGYSALLFEPVKLPAAPAAACRAWVGKGDGSDLGDGILYKLAVIDAAGAEQVVGDVTVPDHQWYELVGDLSAYAGQTVRLKVVADVGAGDDSSGDWAMVADVRIESLEPQPVRGLVSPDSRLATVEGPHGPAGLPLEQLRRATTGRIHYQGVNLSGVGNYPTYGFLNDHPLGNMTPAGGNGMFEFSGDATLALTPDAIASLTTRNILRIDNPNGNCYKLQNVWLELELPGGQQVSSRLCPAIVCQPPSWLYFEGFGVAMADPMTFELWFDLQ